MAGFSLPSGPAGYSLALVPSQPQRGPLAGLKQVTNKVKLFSGKRNPSGNNSRKRSNGGSQTG